MVSRRSNNHNHRVDLSRNDGDDDDDHTYDAADGSNQEDEFFDTTDGGIGAAATDGEHYYTNTDPLPHQSSGDFLGVHASPAAMMGMRVEESFQDEGGEFEEEELGLNDALQGGRASRWFGGAFGGGGNAAARGEQGNDNNESSMMLMMVDTTLGGGNNGGGRNLSNGDSSFRSLESGNNSYESGFSMESYQLFHNARQHEYRRDVGLGGGDMSMVLDQLDGPRGPNPYQQQGVPGSGDSSASFGLMNHNSIHTMDELMNDYDAANTKPSSLNSFGLDSIINGAEANDDELLEIYADATSASSTTRNSNSSKSHSNGGSENGGGPYYGGYDANHPSSSSSSTNPGPRGSNVISLVGGSLPPEPGKTIRFSERTMVIEDGIVYDESLQELDLFGHEQAMLAEQQAAIAAAAAAASSLVQPLTSSSDHSIDLDGNKMFEMDGTGSSVSLMYNKDGSLRLSNDDDDDAASFVSSESSDDGSEEDDEEKKIRKQILWAVGGMVSSSERSSVHPIDHIMFVCSCDGS